jgi:cation diffusion facilitator CzcD-associated flavoprotein CzcO
MTDWLIIGGGIHGTYLSHLLVNRAGLGPERVRVLDPHAAPLAVWDRNTDNCGMRYLRSPSTHNIDLPILSLYRFARASAGSDRPDFIPPYNRPSLDLFRQHSRAVIADNGLQRVRIRGRALALEPSGNALRIRTTAGTIAARRVILCIGLGEQPYWPSWARRLRDDGGRVQHVFDPAFYRATLKPAATTVVMGGGSSAVQTALKLAEERTGEVRLVSPHPIRTSQYDFNPCWIGPKCLRDFFELDPASRRRAVDAARIPGSLPPEVVAELDRRLSQNRLSLLRRRVEAADTVTGRVRLRTDAGDLWTDQLLLATGFSPRRPGGAFVDDIIRRFRLKVGSCGYPVVGADLRWAENIFVAGPLAELQLGPCARNIIGARNAGRHLLKVLQTDSACGNHCRRKPKRY